MRLKVCILILLIQACGPVLAQTPEPEQPDPPGILQRLADRARAARDKVQGWSGVALEFAGEYYQEHVRPVTQDYVDWASNVKTSMWEMIPNPFQWN